MNGLTKRVGSAVDGSWLFQKNLKKLTPNLISSPLNPSHNLQWIYVARGPPAPIVSLPTLSLCLFVMIIPAYNAYEVVGSLITSHFYRITANLIGVWMGISTIINSLLLPGEAILSYLNTEVVKAIKFRDTYKDVTNVRSGHRPCSNSAIYWRIPFASARS